MEQDRVEIGIHYGYKMNIGYDKFFQNFLRTKEIFAKNEIGHGARSRGNWHSL